MILTLVILLIFLLSTMKRPVYGLSFLIGILSISTDLLFDINTTFIVKIMLLLSSVWCVFKYGFKKCQLKILTLSICLFLVSQLFATYTSNYSFMDAAQSMMSIMIGLILSAVTFKNEDRIFLLKVIGALPYLSIILGLYGLHSLTFSGRYGAGTTSTNLSFIATVSCVCLLTLYNEYKKNKYIVFSFISFAICLLTVTRGGILFCIIVLLPHLVDIAKKLKKSQMAILAISLFISVVAIANVWQGLLARMFGNGSSGTLNASGRIEAWAYIIGLNTRFWFGEGIGKLYTLTLVGKYIDHFNAAHNEFVRFYYESGAIGIVLLIVIYYYIFKVFANSNKLSKFQNFMIILAFMIYSFVDNTISNYVFFVPFMLYLNVASSNDKLKKVIFK